MVWRNWVLEHMRREGITQLELQRRIGHPGTSSYVQSILKGFYGKSTRPPNHLPFDQVEIWARALRLDVKEAERLREDANLDLCEEWFQKKYWAAKASTRR